MHPDTAQTSAYFILTGAALLGLVHGLLPDHWLPYVALGRARGWGTAKTLASVSVGAAVHLVATVGLGLVISYLGAGALERIGPLAEVFGAGVLVAFGGVLAARGLVSAMGLGGGPHLLRRHAHGHAHAHAPGHLHAQTSAHNCAAPTRPEGSSGAHAHRGSGHLLVGALLGLRPCAEATAIFLAASAYGLTPSLMAVFGWAAATLAAMLGAVWLSLAGLAALRSQAFTRYGELAAGLIILLMGLGAGYLALFFEA